MISYRIRFLHYFKWKDTNQAQESFCDVNFNEDVTLEQIYQKFYSQAFKSMPVLNPTIEDGGQRGFILINQGKGQIIEKTFLFKSEANYEVKILGAYYFDQNAGSSSGTNSDNEKIAQNNLLQKKQ